jgi:hypothetical protein
MSFHRETPVKKTRSAKWCGWCGESIEAGTPSVYTSGVWEGDFFQARYHPECNAAITRYYTKHKCWGEEMPDWSMNRGGIEERGEPEEEEIPLANACLSHGDESASPPSR